ncbi:uncharacterized protein DDB_G0271670 [Drosophila mojavensis]|uniref:Uncharacterized protein n=1 Tax=Drosophila mojavensis TaxID=7230 RepID=B4KG66_DROMO|nr:uncharacterized protein DDB_G0271670 [Drosophila mojavensis]EDW11053.1 uncharacterized protein Dmoj_GI15971 [Drosophila mojavensis]
MQKTLKKELSFSLDTLERYRAKYGRSASSDTNGNGTQLESHPAQISDMGTATVTRTVSPPPSLFKPQSPPKLTKLQELQQKKEAYMRQREHEREMEQLLKAADKASRQDAARANNANSSSNSTTGTSTTTSTGTTTTSTTSSTSTLAKTSASSTTTASAQQSSKTAAGYSNWNNNHTTLSSQPWCAISDLMYFCDKYEFKTLSTRDLKTHQEIVAEVRALLSGKAPFDQRTRFPGNIHDPENLWVCIGRCASVEYHLQRIISVFRKPLNQLTPDKQRTVRQNFHLAVSELRLDISARISEVRLYDRLVFEREFRLEWQDEV